MNHYPYGTTHGTSSCGWWMPWREEPSLSQPGRVCVTLGGVGEGDPRAELWVAHFLAVVDDFGTLRKVAHG